MLPSAHSNGHVTWASRMPHLRKFAHPQRTQALKWLSIQPLRSVPQSCSPTSGTLMDSPKVALMGS